METKKEEAEKQEKSKKFDEKDNQAKQLEEKSKKIEELTDTLKRLQAEFENYKKWNAKEKTEFVKYAHADMIAQLLPVLDSFEIALNNTGDKEKFIEGIKIIYAQLYSVLEAEGLKPIKATGERFDPYKHEALMKESSDKPEETILEEFQKGYMLNDRVLRHSKVKISGK
ncbi:nucleotide exchange factor GrpE [Candidatus Woesearchaeota archaeon]|nr:nucleotide exchange factor GrpE [Candidatus Woesearchaeota archaeon]